MLYHATGSPSSDLSHDKIRESLFGVYQSLGPRSRIIALPPDYTRLASQAGILTSITHEFFGERLVDVMPALGTHDGMTAEQIESMFPGLPASLVRVHDWRNDVVTIGEVPAEFVREASEGIYEKPWPAQLNKLIWQGKHDLIVSLGQVVPHEVIGMANYNKNLFVGIGGAAGINESHFIGAVYGMERMMGRADTPMRRILNYAQREFCSHLPLLYVLTVIEAVDGRLITRGLFIGDDPECFERASELSARVNVSLLDESPNKIVVNLDSKKYHSTWLGNKAIYRTRMAIADGGELIVLAPGIKTFGEDKEIDILIRKYGYRTTPQVMRSVETNEDLRSNLSAAAHMIHSSSEKRFRIVYCPGDLTQKEIESVGYDYADCKQMMAQFPPEELSDGWNERNGERFYYISNPGLGLWSQRQRWV